MRFPRFSVGKPLTAMALVLAVATASVPSFAADVEQSRTFLESAKTQYEKGDLRATQIELKNALKADPRNVDARLFLAKIYLDGRNGLAAQPEIEAARDAGASVDETRLELGSAYLYQNQWDRALKELVLDEIPQEDQSEARRQRVRAHMGKKDFDTARSEAQAALDLDPDNSALLVEMARLELRARQVDAAKTAIENALAVDPGNVDALLVKGDLTRSTVGLEEALAYFSEAANLEPENINARLERAATLVDLRREDEAADDIAAVYAKAPEHPLAHYLSAVSLARTNKFEEAQELMNRTRGTLESYLPAVQFEGVVSYELGNYAVSIEKMERVIAALPQSIVARRVLGAAYLRQKKADSAYEMLYPLVEAGAEDAALLTLIGTAEAQRGNFDEAMTYFENAVAAAPDRTNLRTQLAMSRIALGDPDRATRELESVLDVEPDSLNALVMLSLIDLREGKFQTSKETATKLVTTYPDLSLGYNLLGASYLGLNDTAKAKEYFELALAKDPSYHEARRNLAQLYRVQGKFGEARRQYLRILEEDRQSAKTMLQLAALSRTEGNMEESVEWLSRAVDVQPTALPPRLELVSAYLVLGDNNRALNEALQAQRDFPNNPVAVELVAKTYAVNGQYDQAVANFDKWIDLDPSNLNARRLRGRTYWRSGDVSGARRSFLGALELSGDKRAVFMDLINLESSEGNLDRALDFTEQLRAEYPSSNAADLAAGDLYMGAVQYERAIAAYSKAWAVQPSKRAAVNMNLAYRQLGQNDKAIDILKEWLKKDPTDIETRLSIGNTHMLSGDYDAALDVFENVLAVDENNAAVLNNVAWIYQQKGDKRMVEVAERAYDLDRDSPMIADTLGWILVKENVNVRLGVDLLETAARRLPENKDIRYHLAYAYYASGNVEQAKRELDDLLRGGETFGSLKEARNLLQQMKEGGGR